MWPFWVMIWTDIVVTLAGLTVPAPMTVDRKTRSKLDNTILVGDFQLPQNDQQTTRVIDGSPRLDNTSGYRYRGGAWLSGPPAVDDGWRTQKAVVDGQMQE